MIRSARAALALVVGVSLIAPATTGAFAPHVALPPRPAASALTLSRLHESARTWREGSRLAEFTRERTPPTGTTFSFRLSEAATVLLSFVEPGAGRTVRGKCVAPNEHNRAHSKCSPVAGTIAHAAHPGLNAVSFDGRLSTGRELAPRYYRLIVSAADTAGHTSAPQTLEFTIVNG